MAVTSTDLAQSSRTTRKKDALAAFHAPVREWFAASFEAPTTVLSSYVSQPTSATATSDATPELTSRELEILRLIAGGMRNQQIADHLDISAATVKRHIANAYAKLGAGHRTEALATARKQGLL